MVQVTDNTAQVTPRGKRRVLVACLGAMGVILASDYLIARVIFLSMADLTPVNLIAAILLLLAELFMALHGVEYLFSVIRFMPDSSPPKADMGDWTNAPEVVLMVPARHEPYDVLNTTLSFLENIDYPNKQIYLLDDSSDPQYKQEAAKLAARHGVNLFCRTDHRGAKAGIVNDCMATVDARYFAVFDADQNPMPGFLKAIIPLLEANPRLAFVQTPQFYTNTETNPIAAASHMQNCIFYEYVCEGKNAKGAMICCGTNMVIRTEAFRQVNGFDERSVTEDFSTTIDLHIAGWSSLYYPHVSVYGAGPEQLGEYLKQQWRWARGNIGVSKKVWKLLLTKPRALSFWQWWEHLITGSYFLIGWAYFILMICPILYVCFDIPPFFMNPYIYGLTFVPYFTMSFMLFIITMSRSRYSRRQISFGIQLSFISIPIYMAAAVSALLGRKSRFRVTGKAGGGVTAYRNLWPELLLWLINYIALIWGINRFLFERNFSLGINLVWITYHFILLSSIFYFRVPQRNTKESDIASKPSVAG